ncbi:lipoprotein insertase outer membrane protein LolB [Candidatus Blochmanniella camponoti]|uniref:Outer-membrane lipoprotein LolB n=1 Tax=Candidatus Blochmanniella camponoti TaxID=108080 RepID=A0AAE9I814_9ENTR|nr:lipoprotein insertase outer membrane protein LolB [Candidatus Blochmannia herculeanus]URJ27559.1 lipoprotein insertase outer membrane protein LolB [Candidatus Blochmannia herculeanus]
MYQHRCFRVLGIVMLICVSCVYHHNFSLYEDKLVCMWNNHKKSISRIFYYQTQGTIIYSVNHQKKMHFRFIWIHNNDNNYCMKLFNIFGLTIISISVENGVVCILNGIICQNNNLKNEIQKWIVDFNYFLKQLQQWIIGLPGSNVEYNLNAIGCLSHVNCCYGNKNISIYYRHYYTNSIPILPKVLDAYYDQHHIKLVINNWNVR